MSIKKAFVKLLESLPEEDNFNLKNISGRLNNTFIDNEENEIDQLELLLADLESIEDSEAYNDNDDDEELIDIDELLKEI